MIYMRVCEEFIKGEFRTKLNLVHWFLGIFMFSKLIRRFFFLKKIIAQKIYFKLP